MMESLVPEYQQGNYIRERTGAILPNIAPSNVYPTKDGLMLVIGANQDGVFKRLCDAMGRPELARGPALQDAHRARAEPAGAGRPDRRLDPHRSTPRSSRA